MNEAVADVAHKVAKIAAPGPCSRRSPKFSRSASQRWSAPWKVILR